MRPLPLPGPDTQPFWDACRRHELRVQRCDGCGRVRFPPRPACGVCGSFEARWIRCSGRGMVYSFTVVHPPTLPAFAADVPYAAGLVVLDEGVFMLGRIRGCATADVQIGQRVVVEFEDVSAEIALPHWRVDAP